MVTVNSVFERGQQLDVSAIVAEAAQESKTKSKHKRKPVFLDKLEEPTIRWPINNIRAKLEVIASANSADDVVDMRGLGLEDD